MSKTLLASKSLQRAPRPLPTMTAHLTKMSPKSTEMTHRLQRLRRSDRHRMRQSEDSFSFKGGPRRLVTQRRTCRVHHSRMVHFSMKETIRSFTTARAAWGVQLRSGRDNLLKKLFMDLERNEISPPTTYSQEHSHALDFFDNQVMETLLLCR